MTGLRNGNPDAGLLTLSFGAGVALDCANYTELTAGTALFEVTGGREKTATLEVDKRDMAVFPNNGASFLQLCFGAPDPFTDQVRCHGDRGGSFDWDGTVRRSRSIEGCCPTAASSRRRA